MDPAPNSGTMTLVRTAGRPDPRRRALTKAGMTVQLRQRESAASASGTSAAPAPADPAAGRIADLINQYPEVGHSNLFIDISKHGSLSAWRPQVS
jgi:hypothetical protein